MSDDDRRGGEVFKVFLSSTSEDLQPHREAVSKVIR